ncbi:EmrB/QacA subfamily drug resistance transporter [Rhodococcus sp. 27YEA15]|uniref:MFS transporter n=1 Tax=Rhodococcus sp. 27YEA15 TaxID=3156259 RepID=UPI003C7E8F2C
MTGDTTATSAAKLVLIAAAAAQFLVAFDMSVINVALPDIQESLHFSDAGLSWVVNAYALAFGGLLLLGGRLCDVVGTRRVLVSGLLFFACVSVIGTFSTSASMLVGARALQGVGAAMIAPAGLAALSQAFPEGRARAKAFGIGAMGSALGGALGVVLSGILTEGLSWRWVMFAGAPIALVAAITGAYGSAASRSGSVGSLDLPGAVLATASITALIAAVIATESRSWTSGYVLGGIALALALLFAFILVETRSSTPLVRLAILRRPRIGLANAIMCLVCAGQFSAFFLVSLYLQRGLGYSPSRAGLAFLPFCVGLIIGIVSSTKILPKYGPRPLLMFGTALAAVGTFGFATVNADSGFWLLIVGPSLATSIGIGLSFMPLSNVATADAPVDEVGMASGLLSTSRQIGGSLGLAATVSVAAAATARADGGPVESLVAGYTQALLVCAVLFAIGTLLSLVFPRKVT